MYAYRMQVRTSSPPTNSARYNYLVRIINPDLKSKFISKVWHDVNEKFCSTKHLKQMLNSTYEEKLPPLPELECGYFEKRPGKCWIENDKDLDAMYRSFNENDEITILCEGKPGDDGVKKTGKNRKSDESECVEDRGSTGLSKRAARETEINRITQELYT